MSVQFKNETVTKHKELADKIKANLVAEGSKVKEKESHEAYYDSLPENLDKKTVEAVASYNQSFVTASHVAIGEMAASIFNENKDIDRVDAQIGFFGKRDKITASVNRTKDFRNNFAEKEEDKILTKHLVMNSTVQTSGFGLKSVREAMSEEFKDKFSK